MTTSTTVSDNPSDPSSDDAPKHSALKRQKTWGERVFNWRTYGGYALLGNEFTSLGINELAQRGPTKNLYQRGISWAKGLEKYKFVPSYIKEGHLQNVLIAVLGGMFMVPFVKHAEDHKGEIVRRIDRVHYGDLNDSDPKLIEAHKEMDEAPKQTWGSLWKGRAITVVSAITVDSLVGQKSSPSVTLLENTSWSRFSSMKHISEEIANVAMKRLKVSEGTGKLVATGAWLLVLSSTLTALFYGSSKLFAKKHEERIERKLERQTVRTNGIYADSTDVTFDAPPAQGATASEKPSPQVKSISRNDTISAVPQLSQGA